MIADITRQGLFCNVLHRGQRLARADAAGRAADDGGRRIEIVEGDEGRADLGAEMCDRTDRHHLVVRTADIEVQQIVGLQPELRLGLHIDLEYLAEFVELVDVGRSEVGRQHRKDIPDRDPQSLRPISIHRHRDVGPAGAERRQDVLQLGIAFGLFDELLREDIQLLVVKASAQQFELHLQAAGIADALDRRRRHDK